MRKPPRPLVLALTLPFIAGCFGVVRTPIPASPTEREDLKVRGVVQGGQDIRFEEIRDVSWTGDQLFIVGRQDTGEGIQEVTRQYPIAGLDAVLVKRLDAGKTSGVVGGVIVGTIIGFALWVTGSDPRVR